MKWTLKGFEAQKKFFINASKSGLLSHAYLFVGPSLIGKSIFATNVAAFLVNDSQSMYILGPSDLGTISIASVRDLKHFMSRSVPGAKVAVIYSAHLMSDEAQNALLKLLEEPNGSAHIFLVTDNEKRLLPTIVSRCQKIDFLSHPKAVVRSILADVKLSDAQKTFLVDFSHGKTELVKYLVQDKRYEDIKRILKNLSDFASLPLYAKLIHAKKISDDYDTKTLQKVVMYWILYMHSKTQNDLSAYKILGNLGELHHRLMSAQFNSQLALERFALSFT